MVYANIQELAAMGIKAMPTSEKLGNKNIKTNFDDSQDEILMMLVRWLPRYMNDLRTGVYTF